MKRLLPFAALTLLTALSLTAVSCEESEETVPEETAMSEVDQNPVERGEYLVTILGCDDCHSLKTFGPEGMGIDESTRLSGHPGDQPLENPPMDLVGMGPGKYILGSPHFTAYVGPWGISYAPNLTPHPTGLGGWTQEQFITAIRKGVMKGVEDGRKMLPPMPWFNYAKLPDEDLAAIFAYLQSLEPVDNQVPAAVPAGPPPTAGAPEDAPAEEGANVEGGA